MKILKKQKLGILENVPRFPCVKYLSPRMNRKQMRSKNVNFPSSASAAAAPSLCEKAVPRALRWELKRPFHWLSEVLKSYATLKSKADDGH